MKKIPFYLSGLICGLFASLLALPSYCQVFERYEWESDPRLSSLSQAEQEIPLLYLKVDKNYQYVYEGEDKSLACYYTEHQLIRVGNNRAVEAVNRIYISTENMLELVDVKARTLSPSGRIVQLDEGNIKEIEDEEAGGGYKIFAIEGAEVGGEVEYYFTKKVSPRYFGREFMQLRYPVKSQRFSLSCPENLEFDFRGYNGLPRASKIDTTDAGNIYELVVSDMAGLPQEPFSVYDASRQRLDFKLAYNSAAGKHRLFTWNDAANRIYYQVYNFSPDAQKEIKKVIKSINFSDKTSETEKVIKAEHFIKTNFYFDENAGQTGEDLASVLARRIGNKKGLTTLFAAIFTELGLRHQLVLTKSRSVVKFDRSFDTWASLDDYLIYFPDLDTYMAPYDFNLRLGLVPSELTATYGMFIRPAAVRDFVYPVAEVKWIPAPDHTREFDNLSIAVSFNEDLSSSEVQVNRSYKGYQASYLKTGYLYLENKQRELLLKEQIEFLAPDAEISSVKLGNPDINYSNWDDPFVVHATYSTPSYIEFGGDVVLFKLGELIGPQSEMYQEEMRHTQVENFFNRGYTRDIRVQIPPGYRIENPEDIDMDVKVAEGEREIFVFRSRHTLKGNLLSVQIEEFYDEIYFPREKFEDFRKVINAAADWNKITLVMKK